MAGKLEGAHLTYSMFANPIAACTSKSVNTRNVAVLCIQALHADLFCITKNANYEVKDFLQRMMSALLSCW